MVCISPLYETILKTLVAHFLACSLLYFFSSLDRPDLLDSPLSRRSKSFVNMGAVFSSVNGVIYAAVALIGLYAGRQAILPKPFPDIPYNRDAASKIFGDVPEMMGHVMRTKRIFVSCNRRRLDLWLLTGLLRIG